MATFNNIYAAEAQQTQLLLITVLGANINEYIKKEIPSQLNPYEHITLNQNNNIIEDLYGDYFSVGSSLKFKRLVDSQYERN